ncbi:MAG: RnfABCDGE type electron transport complex subunit B [Planctomycetes bacterium]|nr:RnfABCDGE type electron transport complex subunit B [Planctomycetota bacterium]
MMIIIILLSGGIMLALALFIAYTLGWANNALKVEVDPRVEAIGVALPGANCGGCGFVGCSDYADAVVHKGASVTLCTVGGSSCAAAIAAIMGVDVEESWPYRPAVHCGAKSSQRLGMMEYRGEKSCSAANITGGVQGCVYGCLGMGDCLRACKFGAIEIVEGLATINYAKCTGCGACAKACPRNIITMVPFKSDRMLVVACSNKDFGKDVRAVCKVGCLGCGACAKINTLFTMQDNLSRIDYDKYGDDTPQAIEAALQKCPMKRLIYTGKPSSRDIDAVASEKAQDIVTDSFATTVDKTTWKG